MLNALISTVLGLNHLAILLAAVVSLVFGALWYSPLLFGKIWAKANGFSEKDMKAKNMAFVMVAQFVAGWMTAYAVATLLAASGIQDIKAAFVLTSFLWLGFFFPEVLASYLWGKKKFVAVVIDWACHLAILLLVATIAVSL